MPLKFLHPRFWLTWLGIIFLRFVVLLPWLWQMKLGEWLGKLLYITLTSRRKISCINIKIAFPELSLKEQDNINRQHFISLGQGLFESAIGWWGSDQKIKKLVHTEGFEYLENTLKDNRVILLGAHFTSLEIFGRTVAQTMPLHVVYRPHQNALIEYLVTSQRSQQYGKAIPKNNIRDMIKSIKAGFPVWYATDQNYRQKGSILVPFFGIDAPTNPGTSRLAKITGAKVIVCIAVRLLSDKDTRKGYLIRFLPPLDNFPSDNQLKDTTRLNQIIESQIKEFPPQYLWTHKRYKHYASEGKDFYKDYLLNNETGCS